MNTLVERIRDRIHDAPMQTEHLLDEVEETLALLTAPYRAFLTTSTAKITVNGDAISQ